MRITENPYAINSPQLRIMKTNKKNKSANQAFIG